MPTGRKIAGALIQAGAGLLAASLLSFLIIRLMPADPAAITLQAWNLPATDESVGELRRAWGLDRPLFEQYVGWASRFLLGDWGVSFRTGQPVAAEFRSRLPISMLIGLSGLLVAILLAVPLGYLAARRPGGIADILARAVAIASQALPAFWLGLMLLWILAVQLRLIRPFTVGPATILMAILLVAFASLGALTRVYRRDLLETEAQPFFRTALAKGLSRGQALWRHGNRHALFALTSSVRAEAGWAIGGTATLEVLFGLPGISQFLVQSISVRDYFVLQAYVMVTAIWMIAMNLVVAETLRRLDPRCAV